MDMSENPLRNCGTVDKFIRRLRKIQFISERKIFTLGEIRPLKLAENRDIRPALEGLLTNL